MNGMRPNPTHRAPRPGPIQFLLADAAGILAPPSHAPRKKP
jgi:hypothetical protein